MKKLDWLITPCFIACVIIGACLIAWGILKNSVITDIISISIFGPIALILAYFQVFRPQPVTSKKLYISFAIVGIAALIGIGIVINGFEQSANASTTPVGLRTPTTFPTTPATAIPTTSPTNPVTVTPSAISTAGTPVFSSSDGALKQFCSDISQGNLNSAYQLLSDSRRGETTFLSFKDGFSKYTSCTFNPQTPTGGSAVYTLKATTIYKTEQFSITLIQNGTNGWKIQDWT